MKDLILVTIDVNYCNFLRQYDDRVPYNFDRKENRPFVGVLFSINDCKYFAPLSSPKSKHLKMKSNIDFLKIKKGTLGVVNFNNMIPVCYNNIKKINFDNNNIKYNKMLREQIYWLNRNSDKLFNKSANLYIKYINKTLNINIYNRCCNFKLLEQVCYEYNKNLMQ